jgi:hypothetical protein
VEGDSVAKSICQQLRNENFQNSYLINNLFHS